MPLLRQALECSAGHSVYVYWNARNKTWSVCCQKKRRLLHHSEELWIRDCSITFERGRAVIYGEFSQGGPKPRRLMIPGVKGFIDKASGKAVKSARCVYLRESEARYV